MSAAYQKYTLTDRGGNKQEFIVGPAGYPISPKDAMEKIKWFLYNNPQGKVEIKAD